MEKKALFEIAVTGREHGEWQGKVTCFVSGEQCAFHSILELLRFIEEKNMQAEGENNQ